MIRFSAGEADQGKRVDRFLFLACAHYPGSSIYKAFKNKDVKINGKRAKENAIVSKGDIITVYLPITSHNDQNILRNNLNHGSVTTLLNNDHTNHSKNDGAKPLSTNIDKANVTHDIPDVVWEGPSLLVVNKPQGIIVQSETDDNFERQVQKWWLSQHPGTNTDYPVLCHRLDQNTGGLIIFAKNRKSLEYAQSEFKHHRINKAYLCMVVGTPQVSQTTLHNWLEKDEVKGRVYIHETPNNKSLPIETYYKTLASNGQYSLLHIEIATGRTHQIRAQLSRVGHPIIGDSKYGSNKINRSFKLHWQALWAYRLQFPIYSSGPLQELSGFTLTSKDIPWPFLKESGFYWAKDTIDNLDS